MQAALASIAVAIGALLAAAAQAQPYPNRPVRVVVGFAAGSGPDISGARGLRPSSARISAKASSSRTAPAPTARSPPRPWSTRRRMVTRCSIRAPPLRPRPTSTRTSPSTSCAISRRLRPSGMLDGYLMLVNPSLPVRTVPEFIAYAKDEPRAVRLARRRQPAPRHGRAVQRQGRPRRWSTCPTRGPPRS